MKEKSAFGQSGDDIESGCDDTTMDEERDTTNKMAHDVSSRKLNEYLFKMVRYRHMDFELARFIMIKSIISP